MYFIGGWGFNESIMAPLADYFSTTYTCELLNGNRLLETAKLRQLIDRCPAPPIVLGWSLGGMLAIEAALEAPKQISALVLLSTTLKFCSDEDYRWGVKPEELRAMKLGIRKNRAETQRAFTANVCAPHSEELVPAETLHEDQAELLAGLDYLSQTDLREKDFSQSPPSLVYHGKKDQIISSNAGRMVSQQLNSDTLMRYNGMGHATPLEQNMIMAANIQFHLNKIDASA